MTRQMLLFVLAVGFLANGSTVAQQIDQGFDKTLLTLFDYLEEHFPHRQREVLVALHSGMRRSEQYPTKDCPEGGLKWGNVDFHNRLVTIPRSKHGGIRHIPMNSTLRATLVRLKQEGSSEYVFTDGIPSKWFTRACRAAGIKNFTWHSLRHTFASRLVMAGVDLRTAQELMGHRTITTTMRYAHLAPAHQAEAVERLVVPQLAPVLALEPQPAELVVNA